MEIGPKRLELMHELIPNEAVMALLVNRTTPAAETIVRAVQAAARYERAQTPCPACDN